MTNITITEELTSLDDLIGDTQWHHLFISNIKLAGTMRIALCGQRAFYYGGWEFVKGMRCCPDCLKYRGRFS